MQFSQEDYLALRSAKQLLESVGLAIKITNLIGKPIEKGLAYLPEDWHQIVQNVTQKSLQTALDAALFTIVENRRIRPAERLHKIAVTLTGAGGGAFGFAALAIELPVSTTIMLRSIAEIARSEGEDLASADAKLACLEVFALGGQQADDDAAESGYFAVRAILARAIADAAEYLAKRSIARESAPAIVRFLTQVANRFGIAVSEKIIAQAVPAVGAAGGALVNLAFINHFQDMARGHFVIRRLERTYGPEQVREEYYKLT